MRQNEDVKMEKLRAELARAAEGNEEYAEFNRRIVNTRKRLLGVRMPDLRKLAKGAARGMDFREVREMLQRIDDSVYEEVMVAGLMIWYADGADAERIEATREWLPMVDSWAEIDSSVQKMRRFDRELWWGFVDECLGSRAEWTVRYGVIFMMENFLDTELRAVFARLRKVRNEGYYVKMGMAWLYADAALRDFEATMTEVAREGVDGWVRKKAYQKMLESHRISAGQKARVRAARSVI